MLRSRAIKKIFMSTLSLFIVLCIYTIPSIEKENVLRTNLEIEDITSITNSNIYLLNNNYLVRSRILLDNEKIEDNVYKILTNLMVTNNNHANVLKGVIPKNTRILEVIYKDNIIYVDFSKEFLNVSVNHEKQLIESIVYSIMEINDVRGVSIMISGESLLKYPNTGEALPMIIDKSIGINNEYLVSSRNNITKVVIYYLKSIDGIYYYVPVTKYMNSSDEKINIILDELKKVSEKDLISLASNDLKLKNYSFDNDIMILNFNTSLYDYKNVVNEYLINSISYSVFSNYDVSMVMFQVDGKAIKEVSKTSIK